MRDNRFETGLLKALGRKPPGSFPPFEKLFGFPLPPRVLAFSQALGDARFLPYPATPVKPAPWSKPGPLSFFLSDFQIYGLLLGLIPIAKYRSDVHLVDVADPEGHGELFLHNHEVGLLEGCSQTLGDWVRQVHIESEETDGLKKVGKAPRSNPARVRTVLDQYRNAYWVIEIFRGVLPEWPKREKNRKDPVLSEPFATHYELLSSSLCGDKDRALRAAAAGRKAAGLLTRTLAETVERNFVRPKSAKLGWLNAGHLQVELPKRYGAGSEAAGIPAEPEPIPAETLKGIAPFSRIPSKDPKAYWIVRMPGGSTLARYPKTKIKGYRFHEGERLAKEFPPKTSIALIDDYSVKGKIPDILFNGLDLLIVSYRVRQVLDALKAASLEYLPVIVKTASGRILSEKYFLLNPIGGLKIVDLEKSQAKPDICFPEQFDGFERLRLNPASVAPNARLFREARNPRMIFLHDSIRKAFRHCGITGEWRYFKAQGWNGFDF